MNRRPRTERGTSTTLSYVLTLSIATLLVAGLILAGSTFVQDHREQVIRQELQVVGEHLASNIEQVDRYAAASDGLTDAKIRQQLPNRVTGSQYDVILRDSGDPTLYLNATNPDVEVQIDVETQADVTTETFAGGGEIAVECEVSANQCDRIVIDNA